MDDGRLRSGNIVIGVMLVVMGLAVALDRAGVIAWDGRWTLWPVILIGLGLARFVQTPAGATQAGPALPPGRRLARRRGSRLVVARRFVAAPGDRVRTHRGAQPWPPGYTPQPSRAGRSVRAARGSARKAASSRWGPVAARGDRCLDCHLRGPAGVGDARDRIVRSTPARATRPRRVGDGPLGAHQPCHGLSRRRRHQRDGPVRARSARRDDWHPARGDRARVLGDGRGRRARAADVDGRYRRGIGASAECATSASRAAEVRTADARVRRRGSCFAGWS